MPHNFMLEHNRRWNGENIAITVPIKTARPTVGIIILDMFFLIFIRISWSDYTPSGWW